MAGQLSRREINTLEALLKRACRSLPHGGDHELRKKIAQKLLESTFEGRFTNRELMQVARTAFVNATKENARRDRQPGPRPSMIVSMLNHFAEAMGLKTKA